MLSAESADCTLAVAPVYQLTVDQHIYSGRVKGLTDC